MTQPVAPPVSAQSLLRHVTLVMVVDIGSLEQLMAAQCTYLQTVDPMQVVYVSDVELPAGGACGIDMPNQLRVRFAVDYFEVCRVLHTSLTPLHPWVLLVKPWTFVNTLRMSEYLEARGPNNTEVYVGRARNASSEMTALAQMPHVAYEYGILMRSWAVVLVGRDKEEYRSYLSNMRGDFHSLESGVSDIAATLYATSEFVAPTQRDDLFEACGAGGADPAGFVAEKKERFNRALTFGPLEPSHMFRVADLLGFFKPRPSVIAAPNRTSSSLPLPLVASSSSLSGLTAKGREQGRSLSAADAPRVVPETTSPESNPAPAASVFDPPMSPTAEAKFRQWLQDLEGLAAPRGGEKGGNSTSESATLGIHVAGAPPTSRISTAPVATRAAGAGATAASRGRPPRVLFAVLAREDSIDTVVRDAMATWAEGADFLTSGAAVLFFYSQREVVKLRRSADVKMRNGLSKVINQLAALTHRAPTTAADVSRKAPAKHPPNVQDSSSSPHRRRSLLSNVTAADGTGEAKGKRAKEGTANRTPGGAAKSETPKSRKGRKRTGNSTKAKARRFHRKEEDDEHVYTLSDKNEPSSLVWVSENLATPFKPAPPHGVTADHHHSSQHSKKKPTKSAVSAKSSSSSVDTKGILAQVRLVGLTMPPMPRSKSNFYQNSFKKPMDWDLWLRAKVAKMVQFLTTFVPDSRDPGLSLSEFSWFVVVDDDTYIKVPQFTQALQRHDSAQANAVGRKFFHPTKNMTLLGGGPGIALSTGAVTAMRAAQCPEKDFPVASHTVPGGDGWLGQCMEAAGVTVLHDWRFKSLPPYAFSDNQQDHAVSFHKSAVRQVHKYLLGDQETLEATAAGPLCNPVLLRDAGTVNCLPHFTIIGAQKAGTTSLFEYLGQHPQVRLPKEKEMNFYGSPWPLKPGQRRMRGLTSFTFDYLPKFQLPRPSDVFKFVAGEASPDYFVSGHSVLPNLLRFAPSMKVIVSLRDPVDRFVSAYKNKVADKTVHRHMEKKLFHGRVDPRHDDEVKGYKVPTMFELAVRVNITLRQCPDYRKHFTLAERPPKVDKGTKAGEPDPRVACFVNPFVLHGYYAKYLRPYYEAFGRERENLKVVDFARFENDSAVVMKEVGEFLRLNPFNYSTAQVFNSRNNRGVHAAGSHPRSGGEITGVEKDELGSLDPWAETLGNRIVTVLRTYFAPCNAELKELLAPHEQMSWT